MNVIENENPGSIVGYGNPSAVLISCEGSTPGPTIRLRGDEVLLITPRNLLGQDYGTNLHTHSIPVRPGRNPDGTHSDNIILRLISEKDLDVREANATSPTCQWLRGADQTTFLRDEETAGFATYQFHIGDVRANQRRATGLPPQPHPPGTHWYHPRCHGSTHQQAASGGADAATVTALYSRLDQAAAWRQSLQFVDISPGTGQKFPGFALGAPSH